MAEPVPGVSGEDRVEELLRVNAALAAEIRSLAAGRTDAPRSAPMPTSRRLATLLGERDTAAGELAAARAELAELRRQRDALRAEVERLRTGVRGALRRVWARLLRA